MREQQEQQGFWPMGTRQTFVLFAFAVNTHAMCFFPLLHSHFGRRGIGAYGCFAAIAMILYAALVPCPTMLVYMKVWLGFVVWRRLTLDPVQHSMYPGFPWLAGLLVADEESGAAAGGDPRRAGGAQPDARVGAARQLRVRRCVFDAGQAGDRSAHRRHPDASYPRCGD